MNSSTDVPVMLYNFKKRFLHPSPQHEQQPFLSPAELHSDVTDTDSSEQMIDSVAQQNSAIGMAGSACTCVSCVESESNGVTGSICRSHPRSQDYRSLPSFRSVMEVLYPPSHLGASSPFPDPPSYSRESPAHPSQEDDTENFSLISPTSTIDESPLSYSHCDPLAQDPSLTGVPSQGNPSRGILLVEPNPPVVNLGGDSPEELLPAYSRFDQRRPRFPAAADILGPYPPLSVLGRPTR